MACLSLAWIQQLLIWLVVIVAIVAIIKIVVPWLTSIVGGTLPGPVWQILQIILWAVVAIAVIIIVFDLISCILGVPRLR